MFYELYRYNNRRHLIVSPPTPLTYMVAMKYSEGEATLMPLIVPELLVSYEASRSSKNVELLLWS